MLLVITMQLSKVQKAILLAVFKKSISSDSLIKMLGINKKRFERNLEDLKTKKLVEVKGILDSVFILPKGKEIVMKGSEYALERKLMAKYINRIMYGRMNTITNALENLYERENPMNSLEYWDAKLKNQADVNNIALMREKLKELLTLSKKIQRRFDTQTPERVFEFIIDDFTKFSSNYPQFKEIEKDYQNF